MMSAELVDSEYGKIVQDLQSAQQNIEPFLLIKSAMLRKKYPLEKNQHFWLDLYYKRGVDPDAKAEKLFHKVGRLAAYHGHGHFLLDLQGGLDTLLEIASDGDLERVTGEVFPL